MKRLTSLTSAIYHITAIAALVLAVAQPDAPLDAGTAIEASEFLAAMTSPD